MTELLILFSLLDEKLTIYEIRQKIERIFFLFLKISFGSIHPALKKLEEKGFVKVKKSLSSGGQRSSVYSITEGGKDYFLTLLNEDFPDNPALSAQLIPIKYIIALKLEKETQNAIRSNILKKLEEQKLLLLSVLNKPNEQNSGYIDFVKFCLEENTAKINWLGGFEYKKPN